MASDYVYAAIDDIKRHRRKSYIPAANSRSTYRGIRTDLVNRTGSDGGYYPRSQTYVPGAGWSNDSSMPERSVDRNEDWVLYTAPGGIGQIGAVRGSKSAQALLKKGYTEPPLPADKGITMPQAAAAYSKGYGAPNPSIVNADSGQYLNKGGVMAPVETLSQSQNALYNPTYRPPATGMATNILRSLGLISNLASYVGTAAGNFARRQQGGLPPQYWPKQDY